MAGGDLGGLPPFFSALLSHYSVVARHLMEALPGVEPGSGLGASDLCFRYTKRHVYKMRTGYENQVLSMDI